MKRCVFLIFLAVAVRDVNSSESAPPSGHKIETPEQPSSPIAIPSDNKRKAKDDDEDDILRDVCGIM